MLSPASVRPTEPSFANQNIQQQSIVFEFCMMSSMNHKSSATTITIDIDISRLKNRVKPVPMLHTVGRQRLKLNTALTLWDRKAAPRTALWLGCSVGIEGEVEQHRAIPPSVEWLPTRGIDTSLALAPWSDKKKSPLTWTLSWRQNAAETSGSRPPSLGSQVMTKLTLHASVERSTF